MIEMEGPTHCTVRNLSDEPGCSGTTAISGINIENIDQPGARVYGRNVRTSGGRSGVLTQNLATQKPNSARSCLCRFRHQYFRRRERHCWPSSVNIVGGGLRLSLASGFTT